MKKKIFKITAPHSVLLPLALIITGCAGVSYQDPKSGPVTRVRFVTDTTGPVAVRSYASKECDGEYRMMDLRNGVLLGSEPRRLGIPLWNYHTNAAKEVLIRAGIPQFYMFQGVENSRNYIKSCGIVVQQKFEEGKDYEVSYKWSRQNCKLEVYEIKTNASGDAEKILLQKRDNRLDSDFTQSCLAKFKQQRWF
ncbi:MAG: hypothetical protein K0M45_04000 [Candidatus Paracaedibacteraceae bacterium]|nr:hypothetical protein [Candidatus Paracaedibacteraceae bacterium]